MKRTPKGRLELTWMGKDSALIPVEDGKYDYAWVDPTDPRAREVKSIEVLEQVGEIDGPNGAHENLLIIGDSGDALRSLGTIPDDPEGPISMRRLRRTLAWFIYRRPRGRVALGIQYGHLHAATTDGYGTRVSAGLRDLFPMEEALALSDTLSDAAQQLQSQPTVSGPAADRYKAAAQKYTHRFAGLTLTARQAADLAADPDVRVYDSPGQVMACCFDPSKALCRTSSTEQSKSSTTPDLTACDSRCANIARTDQHIEALHRQVTELEDERTSDLTPEPIRHRLQAQIQHRRAIIASHEQAGTS